MVKRKSNSRSKSYRGRRQRGGFFAPKVQILDEEGRKKVEDVKKGFLSGLSAIGKKTSDSLKAAKDNIVAAKNKVAAVSSAVGSKIGTAASAVGDKYGTYRAEQDLISKDKKDYKEMIKQQAKLNYEAKKAATAAKNANIIATAIAGGGRRKSRRSKSRKKSHKRRSSRKKHSKSHKKRLSYRKRHSRKSSRH